MARNDDFGTVLRESSVMFPVVEGTHLLALGISVGTIAISDLRLLGVTMKQERVSEVTGQLLPSIAGFIVMFATGGLLFALVFHLTIFRRMPEWDRDPDGLSA